MKPGVGGGGANTAAGSRSGEAPWDGMQACSSIFSMNTRYIIVRITAEVIDSSLFVQLMCDCGKECQIRVILVYLTTGILRLYSAVSRRRGSRLMEGHKAAPPRNATPNMS